ncbi:MAG: glycerophosphodiester phosphodiesterase [Acidimicrobiales bacterium]
MTQDARLVMAHRGASSEEQENTIAAFELAATLGADYIELDVRFTADRALVVHHNPTLDDGRVLREVNEVDLPQWLPSLRAALGARGSSVINIEIKNVPGQPDFDPTHAIVEPVARMVVDNGLGEHVLVSSFDAGVLSRLAEVEPSIGRAQLMLEAMFQPGDLVQVAELGAVAVHPQAVLVDEAFMREANEVGLQVNAWVVDDPQRQLELYDLGVNAVCTNDPGRLLSLLGRR